MFFQKERKTASIILIQNHLICVAIHNCPLIDYKYLSIIRILNENELHNFIRPNPQPSKATLARKKNFAQHSFILLSTDVNSRLQNRASTYTLPALCVWKTNYECSLTFHGIPCAQSTGWLFYQSRHFVFPETPSWQNFSKSQHVLHRSQVKIHDALILHKTLWPLIHSADVVAAGSQRI